MVCPKPKRIELAVRDDVDASLFEFLLAEGAIVFEAIALGGAADDLLSPGTQGLCFLSLSKRVIEDDDVGPVSVFLRVLGFGYKAVSDVGFFLILDVIPDFMAFFGHLPCDVADQSAERVEEESLLFHAHLSRR